MSKRSIVVRLILIVILAEASATAVVALADRPPFELGIGILLGSVVGGGLIGLALAPKRLLSGLASLSSGKAPIFNRPLGLMVLCRFDWPVLGLAAYLIGITPMAIIWALKPVMFILCMRRLVYNNDGQRRYQPLARTAWLWLALAAIGVVLVGLGRSGQTGTADNWWLTLLGILAGVTSTALSGLSGIRFEWGRRLVSIPSLANKSLELPIIAFGLALASLPAVLALTLAYRIGGNWPAWENVWPGIIVGLIIASGWAIATAAWLKIRRLEIGGLFYLTPLASIILLLAVGRLGDINPPLIGLGGLLVLGSGLALVQADRRARQPTS